MKIFYFSIASGSQRKTVEKLRYPYILINFMTKINTPPRHEYKLLFIDSGGFTSSFQHESYTKSDEEYLSYVESTKPNFFALRDYPCEPEILHKYARTVKDHIYKTLEHHLKLLDKLDNFIITAKPIPVLQGWKVEDYLYSIDLYKEHGLILDYMAIGSLCRRTSTNNIIKIIYHIKQNLPSWVKLHGFGIKISVLKNKFAWDALYSVDSGAWDYLSRWKNFLLGEDRKKISINLATEYINKIEKLKNKHESQKTLWDVLNESTTQQKALDTFEGKERVDAE